MNEGTSGCENLAGRWKNMKEYESCVSRNCLAHLGASHRKTDSQIPEASSRAKAVDLAQLQDKGVQSPAHAVLDLHWTQTIAFAQKLNGLRRKQALWSVWKKSGMFGSLFSVLRMLSGDGSLKLGGVVLGVCKTESALDQNTLFASVHYGTMDYGWLSWYCSFQIIDLCGNLAVAAHDSAFESSGQSTALSCNFLQGNGAMHNS